MVWRYEFADYGATAVFLDSAPPAPPREVWPVGRSSSTELIRAVTRLEFDLVEMVRPYQFHSDRVFVVDRDSDYSDVRADALLTEDRQTALCILTADCVPVALATESAVAIAHCGWRGILSGLVSKTVHTLRNVARGGDVKVAIGPHICADCYEFEGDSAATVRGRFGGVAFRTVDNRQHLDLSELIKLEVERSGAVVVAESGQCTFESSNLSSFRRDATLERQASFVFRSDHQRGGQE